MHLKILGTPVWSQPTSYTPKPTVKSALKVDNLEKFDIGKQIQKTNTNKNNKLSIIYRSSRSETINQLKVKKQ